MEFILSIDQGTTGTTAILVDAKNFRLVDKVNQEFPQIFPKPGLVEHNLNDIWNTVKTTIEKVLTKNNIRPNQISSIGLTNQRETTCAFNKKGEPLANAIVWQDRRTAEFCASLNKQGISDKVKNLTGLPVDPYFSATKMKWLLENNDQVKQAAKSNDLFFGTIDTFLLYKFTNGESFATEATNASRTLLMNLSKCTWDEELLNIFCIPKSSLPEIKNSFDHFGKTKGLHFLPDGITITGILGDQQSALFGQAGYEKGGIKSTYGTGSFILLNVGEKIVKSKHGLLSTVAYKDSNKVVYALEGSCYIAGAAVQWLRDKLKMLESSSQIEALAASVTNLAEMEYVLFLPFFTGIGSPHWLPNAKAAILGLTRDTESKHIARACLEGIALSINDLVSAMKNDTNIDLKELRVDGGATANNLLMEIQATVSKLNIIRPSIIETTGYGAALAAAVGAKHITYSNINSYWKSDRVFEPNKKQSEYYQAKDKQWKESIERLYFNR